MPVAFESIYTGFYLYFATHCHLLVSEPNRNRIMFVFGKLIAKIIEAANGSQVNFVFKEQAAEILRWIVHLNLLKKNEIVLRYTAERFEQRPTLNQVLKKVIVLTEITTGYRPNQDPSFEYDHVCPRELNPFLVQELRWFLSWISSVSEMSLRDLARYQQRQSDPVGYERDLREQRGLYFLPMEFLPYVKEKNKRERQFEM
jgi:hypothetical protein